MAIEIRRVTTSRDLKVFKRIPFALYKDCPYWVPPISFDEDNTLRKDKNAAFEFCEAEYWIAYKDGRPVGRIAGIINQRAMDKWGNKNARFGWIDFIEDFEVAKALVTTVEDWARSKGMEALVGPLGFTDLDREGMLVEGFNELSTYAMIYNHPYYPQYIERLGYGKDVDWLEYEVKVPASIPEKARRVQDLIEKRTGIHEYIWKSKKVLVDKFSKDIFHLINEAYAELYGTFVLTEKQIDGYIDQYLGFADPRFVKFVVDKDDHMVAFGIAMPSLSRALQECNGRLIPFGWISLLRALKHPKTIDMYLVAVRPEYKARGVIAFLMTSLAQSCIEAGVVSTETNAELETNVEVQGMWKDFERRQHKRRRCFKKAL
jgi:GNAT superfamily N-acetyltransferase